VTVLSAYVLAPGPYRRERIEAAIAAQKMANEYFEAGRIELYATMQETLAAYRKELEKA